MGTKEYHAQKSREHYDRNKDNLDWLKEKAEYSAIRRHAQKAKVIEHFGGKCLHCSGIFPACVFEFHHLNPEEKEITPAFIFNWSWENIQKEMAKCVMLCANCHRLEHHRLNKRKYK